MRRSRSTFARPSRAAILLLLAGCAGGTPAPEIRSEAVMPAPEDPLVLRGRALVIEHDCGGCHGGYSGPEVAGWMAGPPRDAPTAVVAGFSTWAKNLTPDPETGIGRYTERQIFNALRYGLRPGTTPDVEITSGVPGEGNHPAAPDYLAPSMPWVYWRYMSDDELRAIAAYLKRGLEPVVRRVPESQAPPDRWAGAFQGFAGEALRTHVLPPFPTRLEMEPPPERRAEVLRGRQVAAQHACADCHGRAAAPDRDGWMAGMTGPDQEFQIGPFKTRPRNLTPHNTTGMGRFTERQIFNSLRYGLRPGETPDVEITSTTPGVGNHPEHPKYLAPPMPWPGWRHMSDADLRAIAAYLKLGVRPVMNRVADSEGPPDFWLGEYTPEKYGAYPAVPFPTAAERRP